MQNHKKGNIYIISAASGTGKTTLVSRLLKNHDDIRVSISHTTRQPREGEAHGVHYHFVPKEEFESLIEQRAFLEHANVFGNYYGTSIAGVNSLSEEGYDVILEIDVQGALIAKKKKNDAVLVFFRTKDMETLEQRLRNRKTDSEEVIQLRLKNAAKELEYEPKYDYTIINNDIEHSCQELIDIINS